MKPLDVCQVLSHFQGFGVLDHVYVASCWLELSGTPWNNQDFSLSFDSVLQIEALALNYLSTDPEKLLVKR